MRKALQAIRIERGIHQNDRLFQKSLDFRALGGGQIIGIGEAGIGAAGFVTMNGKTLINHYWHSIQIGTAAAIFGKRNMILPDFVDILMVFGRGDGKQKKQPSLKGFAPIFEGYAVACLSQGLHVEHELVMGNVPFADLMSDDIFWGRYFLVVADVLWKIVPEVKAILGKSDLKK